MSYYQTQVPQLAHENRSKSLRETGESEAELEELERPLVYLVSPSDETAEERRAWIAGYHEGWEQGRKDGPGHD